ncbi:MAG: winged helix-turn-helix domain-containing protein [Acidobacteriota bacterium]
MRFAIGEATLNTATYELVRDGETVTMEPRVQELLVYLIENRERVVSKQELFERVWREQHIGESALSRAIYAARRVLGDDAKRQSMIKTVYGKGYQFTGPVTVVTNAPVEEIIKTPTIVETPTGAGIPEPLAPPAHRNRLAFWAVAVLMVGGLVGWWFQVGGAPDATEPTEPAFLHLGRLAVLPIDAIGDEPAIELTALSMTDQLAVRLGSQPGLTLRSLAYSEAVFAEPAEPTELLEALQVDAFVTGTLRESAVADRLELTVDLFSAPTGGMAQLGVYEIGKLDSEAALRDFLRIREAITNDVIEILGLALVSGVPDGMSPSHPEALRLMLEARRRFATITCGDAAILLDLIDRVLVFDPNYAVAWTAKGFALYSQTWSCGRDASYVDQALEAVAHARQLAPLWAVPAMLETTLLVERGDAETAYAHLVDLEQQTPPSPTGSYAESYVLRYAGYLDASQAALDEALELDPLVLREFATAPVTLLYRGDNTRFLDLMPASDTPHDRFYRGWALALEGETDAALDVLGPALELNPSDLFARYAATLEATLEGRQAAALEMIRSVIQQRSSLGTPDGEMTFKEAQLLALAGDVDGAVDRLGDAVDKGFFCPRCIADDPVFSELEGDSRFAWVLDRATERHRDFGTRFDLIPAS